MFGGGPIPTLENVDNAIQGAGQIGGGYYVATGFNLINDAQGVIDANSPLQPLIINTPSLANSGLLEATAAAGLTFSAGQTVDQSEGGTILAAGGNVNFQFHNIVKGGTLTSISGSEIVSYGLNLDGTGALPVTITAGSQIVDNTNLYLFTDGGLTGRIVNQGTIQVGTIGTYDYVISGNDIQASPSAGGTVMLSGGGTLKVNAIFFSGFSNPTTLLDNVDNTIVGAFSIATNMENDAAGVIDATAASYITAPVVNNGLIEATAGAGLAVTNLDQSGGGTLLADGVKVTIGFDTTYAFYIHGSQSGGIVRGGTLTARDGGVIQGLGGATTFDGSNADGITISAGTAFGTADGLILTAGAGQTAQIINHGSITLNPGNILQIGTTSGGTVQFSGGGTIIFAGGGPNLIVGEARGGGLDTFENVDNTVTGAGFFNGNGFKQIAIVNDALGVIDANVSGGSLQFVTGNAVVNNGLLKADGGAIQMTDAVSGAGSALVTNGGSLNFLSTFNEYVAFSGPGMLSLTQPYGGVISGFATGDVIDLTNVRYTGGQPTLSSLNSLTFNEGGTPQKPELRSRRHWRDISGADRPKRFRDRNRGRRVLLQRNTD